MRHPILTRAVRDVTILPKHGEFLTIPLNALAYGRRVGEFEKFRLVKKGEGGGSKDGKEKKKQEIDNSLPAWLLVRSVTQKRDPTLLPTYDEILSAAALGVKRAIKAVRAKANL